MELNIRRLVLLTGLLCAAGRPCAAAPDAPRTDYEQLINQLDRADVSEADAEKLIELGEQIKARAKSKLTLPQRVERALLAPWVAFGFAAQFVFMMRFVVQWIASERKKKSHVPVAFWYLSLIGGVMLFIYALKKRDPVFVLGQGLGLFIYLRNLLLIYKRAGAYRELQETRGDRTGSAGPASTAGPDAPTP
jgi:lipid-A-disaccharide synthase-like uncharacterized protein